MKISDIRELSLEDLKGRLADEQANYRKLKMGHKVSQLESPITIRNSRKDIAKMMTVLNQKLAQQ